MVNPILPLTERQRKAHELMAKDLPSFAKYNLKIQTKDPKAPLINLTFNKAQRYIHEKVEDQLKRTGKVRKIIIKGRQQGASTYITARAYHKATINPYTSVYILSHEGDATTILFNKVKTYYDNCEQVIKPTIDEDNYKALAFDNGSRYGVGTAGAKATGRAGTNHIFHGSEPAHYEKGSDVQAGALQTLSSFPGSEGYLETTGNGMNWFYKFTMNANKGLGEWEIIFVPWYWSDEYRAQLPKDFKIDEEESELIDAYGLDDEQIQWRRNKIAELDTEGSGTRLFKQEYPFTLEEAFQSSNEPFIPSIYVQKAMASKVHDYDSPTILGVDPGRTVDRFVIAERQGREIREPLIKTDVDTNQAIGLILTRLEDKHQHIDMVFIDYGLGYGIVDGLWDLGHGDRVRGIHFGEESANPIAGNKRAEMLYAFRDWLKEGPVSIHGNQATLTTEIAAVPEPEANRIGRYTFVDKKAIRKTLGHSPDVLDATMLTFAFPVGRSGSNIIQTKSVNTEKGSALSTVRFVKSQYKEPYVDDGKSMKTRQQVSRILLRGNQWGSR